MSELNAVLLSWAVTLTGYPAPATPPQVVMVSHAYLEEAACAGRPCKVLGWFPPGDHIFIDDQLNAQDDLYASSVVVHEMVHFLQQSSGKYPTPYSCEDAIAMEREAYGVQQAYLVRYGVYRPIGVSMHNVGCTLAAKQP
jgi:hypothetical protein